ncbi:MAG: PorT family protein, partial [Bacteroidetes bacterium]|nr:PorT family protein [Bacteroidota bacterium]
TNYYFYPANYSIVLKYEFVEIPLIFKYKLINKKIGFNILGGFSAAYLFGDKSYVNIGNTRYNIGKNENIDKFMYSCIFGIGLKYTIYKKISVNFEPNIKYALKPIYKNDASKYIPYLISVSMGVCYDFK